MGDDVFAQKGMTFNTNSLGFGTNKTIGKEFSKEHKEEGMYRLTGFSIVSNGRIVNYIEDFKGLDSSSDLQSFINTTLTKNNLQLKDVQIKVHLGNSTDKTRLGWIDITNLINSENITDDMLKEYVNKIAVESGTITNFQGEYITLRTGAHIKIFDENHNLIKAGTKVIGSDGKEYIFDSLSMDSHSQVNSRVEHVVDTINNGKKLSWKITDCSLLLGLAPALAGVAINVNNVIKNKKANNKPDLFDIKNEEEFKIFKNNFEKAKYKLDKSSKFSRTLKKLFFGERVDLMQKLTDEQVKQLYASIERHAGRDFVKGPRDRISIENGKIKIRYANNTVMDITDIVMPDIALIGSSNDIESEGLLEKNNDSRSI